MNYFNYQLEFFKRIKLEPTIKPVHISLFMVLLQHWNRNRLKNPIGITRDTAMQESKIASIATYHKTIQHLQQLGFIRYEPSYNPHIGTAIYFLPFSASLKVEITSKKQVGTSSKNEHLKLSTCSKNEQAEKEVYIYNNNTNKNNKIYIDNHVQSMNRLKNNPQEKKGKPARPKFEIPTMENILEYFTVNNSTKAEAERFNNYYSSNGWLVGGKTQMKDWQAAARNWMLNSQNFRPKDNRSTGPGNLHVNNDKNYSEPL